MSTKCVSLSYMDAYFLLESILSWDLFRCYVLVLEYQMLQIVVWSYFSSREG